VIVSLEQNGKKVDEKELPLDAEMLEGWKLTQLMQKVVKCFSLEVMKQGKGCRLKLKES